MSKKIFNWVLGKQEPETEKKTATTDNAVDAQKELLDAITAFFKQHFFGIKTFTDTVVIWVDNSKPVYQSYVRDKEFKNILKTELDNNELYAVSKAKFEFRTENPPQDLGLSPIAEGIYIQLIAKEKEDDIPDKAIIAIFNGKGSLKEPEYRLDGATQLEFNIGRGDGNNNDVIINDNDPVNKEINSCVSREHAKIVFDPEKGFCLETRNVENRTIVHRKNQRICKLEELGSRDKFLLKDNDVIELGDKEHPLLLKIEIKKNFDIL